MARFPVKVAMLKIEGQEESCSRDSLRGHPRPQIFARDAGPESVFCDLKLTLSRFHSSEVIQQSFLDVKIENPWNQSRHIWKR